MIYQDPPWSLLITAVHMDVEYPHITVQICALTVHSNSFLAVAHQRRSEPCTRSSTEGLAAHRVCACAAASACAAAPIHLSVTSLRCSFMQTRGRYGAVLGCVGSLLVACLQAEHSRSIPYRR